MVGLLAPVPEEHLRSGLDVIAREGKVAFGTRAWEVFYQLDALLNGKTADVLIFASDAQHPLSPPQVSWRATYLAYIKAKGGAHPEGMRYRPPTTAKYPNDNKGHWALFWEVRDLEELPASERLPIANRQGLGKAQR